MKVRRSVALVPNATNVAAEAIRNRTRCFICDRKIVDGDFIVEEVESVPGDGERRVGLYHAKCFDERR